MRREWFHKQGNSKGLPCYFDRIGNNMRYYVASFKRPDTIMYYDDTDMIMHFRMEHTPHKDYTDNKKYKFQALIKNDEYYITKEKANEICRRWYRNLKNG